MKLTLLTYADEFYAQEQKNLADYAATLNVFDRIVSKTREDLVTTKFYKEYKKIFDGPRSGYHLWKPYFLWLELMKNMEPGDAIMFMDADDWIEKPEGMREKIEGILQKQDMILTLGAFKNADWTKRDCFINMGCDEPKYHDAIQLESGICVFRKTTPTMMILMNWVHYCANWETISDDKSIHGPDYPGFKEHRHDQSVLTNLKVKFDLYASHELREFVICDKFHKNK